MPRYQCCRSLLLLVTANLLFLTTVMAKPVISEFIFGNLATPTCIRPVPDGGFIVSGYSIVREKVALCDTCYNSVCSGFLLRLNTNGDPLWSRRYSLRSNSAKLVINSWFSSVAPIGNDAFIAVGVSTFFDYSKQEKHSSGLSSKAWVVKVNQLGDTLWTKRLGYEFQTSPDDVGIAPDGTILVVGDAERGITIDGDGRLPFTMKLSPSGDSLWMQQYTRNYATVSNSIIPIPNRQFLISATKHDYVSSKKHNGQFTRTCQTLLYTIDDSGRVIVSGDSLKLETGFVQGNQNRGGGNASAIFSSDSSVICFTQYSNLEMIDNASNCVIYSLNSSLQEVNWRREINDFRDVILCDLLEVDDGYVFLGRNHTQRDSNRVWLAKLNRKGKVLWKRIVPSLPETVVERFTQAPNGDFLLVGKRNQNIVLIRVNRTGE